MRLLSCVLMLTVSGVTTAAWAQRGTAGAAGGAAGAVAKAGAFEITSATAGAEVFIDGERIGTIPLGAPLTTLIPGEHTIKVVKPGFAPYIDVFKIDRRKPTRLEVELVAVAGVLRVKANVEAARLYVDGKFVGEAPITTEVQVGARAVQLSKGGYKDFFQNVSAVAGQDVNLDITLEELPIGVNPYKPPPPPPPRWYEKWWVWTVGAVGVGVVVTAVVVPVYYATRDPLGDFCRNNACQGGVVGVTLMPPPK
ncbi:MAG: S-layer-like array protein [Myxococcales bacterium]|nr:S-layer-like array protein [Myxococcales bacterium]